MFIKEKYEKTSFKNRESPCYFSSSWGQKIKNITKLEQTRLFLFTVLVTFFIWFLEQKLIYTINIGFNFVFGFFFEEDFLQKDDLYVHVFQNRNWCSPNMRVRGHFQRKDFKWKNMEVQGDFLKKMEALYAELNKRAKAPPEVVLHQAIFYIILILCLWLRVTRRCNQGV